MIQAINYLRWKKVKKFVINHQISFNSVKVKSRFNGKENTWAALPWIVNSNCRRQRDDYGFFGRHRVTHQSLEKPILWQKKHLSFLRVNGLNCGNYLWFHRVEDNTTPITFFRQLCYSRAIATGNVGDSNLHFLPPWSSKDQAYVMSCNFGPQLSTPNISIY